MKNDFIIRGKEATLFVEAPPNVGYGSVEVKLDAADMDLVTGEIQRTCEGIRYSLK